MGLLGHPVCSTLPELGYLWKINYKFQVEKFDTFMNIVPDVSKLLRTLLNVYNISSW